MQPPDTENQVETAQVEGDTVDGEGFPMDEDVCGQAYTGAANAITISNQQ
jgi:hypothetical protein